MIKITLNDQEVEYARRLGSMRNSRHVSAGNQTERFFADAETEDVLGMAAEVAFSRLSGLPVDEKLYSGGDDGIDFTFMVKDYQVKIDVKGARKPANLLAKAETILRVKTDIYVLAGLYGREVTFLGWETRKVMVERPTANFGYGIINHYQPQHLLQKMPSLLNRIDPHWEWRLDFDSFIGDAA